jgi:fatty acid desaturase
VRQLQAWFQADVARETARRWTLRVLMAWVIQVALGIGLGRLGIVSQILAPSAGAKQTAFAFAAIGLMLLRILVLVVGPPVLAYLWVLAVFPRRDRYERRRF